MRANITETLAGLIILENQDMPNQLQEQEELLNSIECENSNIGKWLEEYELPVFIQILTASDEYISESFPEMKSWSLSERQSFAIEVEEHANVCQHCHLKVQYDLDWKKEVDLVIAQNRTEIKANLRPKKIYQTGA